MVFLICAEMSIIIIIVAKSSIIFSSQQSAIFYDSPAIIHLFSSRDPISGGSGSSLPAPARGGTRTQYVAVLSAVYNAICCIPYPDRDLMPGGRYCRFAYFLTVVHFRKVVNKQKIGSAGNGHPVI
ncbi:hypothetical protein ACOY6L_19565 [Enterobacter roggenkampii]|uniref:hypothetical protein n=1 Tax=Enterobacter roggenkampii TaxID=1812935 RepID=UPI003BCEEDDA